ncbi:unnamed protein product [Angiostrongylus costaricensis]|uniref:Centrosomal protein of 162 kDa n=1 Tax=Angiostrongylus costaricensis TaxID=334426 RepID=A0A0R3PSM9_ANGCS|nr:unnamed protein product [Angiostrongylus costaricensis]
MSHSQPCLIVPNNQKLIQSLREENLHLKREIEASKKKLVKLQQMEAAYERIEKDYENLLREKERQEGVEKTALVQMEMHLKRFILLIPLDSTLQDRLEQFSLPNAQAMEKVNQLNMLVTVKERQRLELEAQNATLEEQRTHISMLEKALSNAQERLAKREKVCDELTIAAERANHLQRLLHETLLDKQARDETHAQERVQWEMDMTQLKMQLNKVIFQSFLEEVIYFENVFLVLCLRNTSEERVKLGEILDANNDTAIGMHKMEEIRQKIQERKRKGRICATGG